MDKVYRAVSQQNSQILKKKNSSNIYKFPCDKYFLMELYYYYLIGLYAVELASK